MSTPGLDIAFDHAADRYDLMTRLNPGYHRHLRVAAAALTARLNARPAGAVLIDLGCGSGLSTAALLAALPTATAIGIDASAGMLAQARIKDWSDRARFVRAGAAQLPRLDLPPAHGVLAAYLFRNIPAENRDDVLRRVHRQLRPGGWLVVQEYSVAGRRWASLVWTLVSWLIVIPLATLLRARPGLYRYLWRSVRAFDSTDRFLARLRIAGFDHVTHLDVGGWQHGILHIFLAHRAESSDHGESGDGR